MGILEKIGEIEKEIGRTQKNKGVYWKIVKAPIIVHFQLYPVPWHKPCLRNHTHRRFVTSHLCHTQWTICLKKSVTNRPSTKTKCRSQFLLEVDRLGSCLKDKLFVSTETVKAHPVTSSRLTLSSG